MISIKHGVSLLGLSIQMAVGLRVVEAVYLAYGYDCVITCGTNGEHSRASLHYTGNALDFRTRHITSQSDKSEIVKSLTEALGPEFDVVQESTHIHVEYQPKKGVNL